MVKGTACAGAADAGQVTHLLHHTIQPRRMHLWVLSNLLDALLLLAQGQKGTDSTRICAQSSGHHDKIEKWDAAVTMLHAVSCHAAAEGACFSLPCCAHAAICREGDDHQQTRVDSISQHKRQS
jgi:hypothetical protein